MPTHSGQCHCGAVQFEFNGPSDFSMTECNCSVCSVISYQHIFVPIGDFTITKGADNLTIYRFGTGAAKHMFCKTCGVKSFYRPRSHPESYSVNLRCIETGTLNVSKVISFDGRNWERNIDKLHKES